MYKYTKISVECTVLRTGVCACLCEYGPPRWDAEYMHTYNSDGRRPDRVNFGTSLKEDLARRDFTINALAVNVRKRYVCVQCFVYVYKYLCVRTCACVYVCMCVCVCALARTPSASVRVYMTVCMYALTQDLARKQFTKRACIHTWFEQWRPESTRLCLHAHIHTHIHAYIHTQYIYIYTFINVHTHTCPHVLTHTHTHFQRKPFDLYRGALLLWAKTSVKHINMHAYIHTCVRTHMRAYTHTHAFAFTGSSLTLMEALLMWKRACSKQWAMLSKGWGRMVCAQWGDIGDMCMYVCFTHV